jgi:hypothetical protein
MLGHHTFSSLSIPDLRGGLPEEDLCKVCAARPTSCVTHAEIETPPEAETQVPRLFTEPIHEANAAELSNRQATRSSTK